MTYLPYEELLNGSIMQASLSSYDLALGGIGAVYMVIWLLVVIVTAIKTKNITSIGVISLITVLFLQGKIPALYSDILYGVTLITFAISLFKFWTDRRS